MAGGFMTSYDEWRLYVVWRLYECERDRANELHDLLQEANATIADLTGKLEYVTGIVVDMMLSLTNV